MKPKRPLILLTGATGRIGPHVLAALSEAGYMIRSAGPVPVIETEQIQWHDTNFLEDVDYNALVRGVDAIVHLAAELWNPTVMDSVNACATEQLCAAAETEGVRFFLYTSTVGVYGHPSCNIIDEETPTLSLATDGKNEFLASNDLLDYCLTKLRGEVAMRRQLKKTRGIILRLSNVTSEDQIRELFKWSLYRRIWRGGRRTHQIYVKDVAAAINFFVEGFFRDGWPSIEQCCIFNISEDLNLPHRYYDIFKALGEISGSGRNECPFYAPGFLDILKDRLKYGIARRNLPAGRACYTPAKLMALGFTHPFGIRRIQSQAIREYCLNRNAENAESSSARSGRRV